MDIHRRARPSNADADAESTKNAAPSPPSRVSKRMIHGPTSKSRTMTQNPYHAASTMTDVILFRAMQAVLVLASIWFLYLIVVANTPWLDTTPISTDSHVSSSRLRGRVATKADPKDISAARDKISQLRKEFYGRYGGEKAATEMLERGLRTFENQEDNFEGGGSVRSTANRFLSAIVRHEASSASGAAAAAAASSQQPEFVMAFAGYSVTVGRGNHLEQSYPFVLEKILAPVLQLPPLGIKLKVRNSAIGGIPSFPYGWCLSNFLGEDADLVSWDYGMNEGNGASGLESYVRHSLMMPKSPPLFVLLDMKRGRLDLLQKYVNSGALPDPVALGGRDAVDKKLLQLPEGDRPFGLQKWDEWGAPNGAPGQSSWHPKKMEHELMGWMMAMRMLDALDVALDVMDQDADWRNPILAQEQWARAGSAQVVLPPPVTDIHKTGAASLLVGSESESGQWRMNHISCRTSFLPNISGDLNSIVQSGVTKDDEDMLQTRDDSLFNGGWVMDVGKVERDTKLKVLKYGGLGYIDMKTALYGIPSSGTLKIWLPYESGSGIGSIKPGDDATKYFDAVVLCEVNEKRGNDECKMSTDLTFSLGGVMVSKSGVSQVKGVASYLKKDICILLEIPKEAKISPKGLGGTDSGLAVEVVVSGTGVTRENGACSISHVIWENR
mmetsp:Transcript_3249/g.8284  ORF Transcript_3249/g.8284 Transcript_3249/m.8284 type:complete len:668 (+) Transcript_3249:218-2221(+)